MDGGTTGEGVLDALLAEARGLDDDLAAAELAHATALRDHTEARLAADSLRLPHWPAWKALLTGQRRELREAADLEQQRAAQRVSDAWGRIHVVHDRRDSGRLRLERARADLAAAAAQRDRSTYDRLVAASDPRAAELDALAVGQAAAEDRLRELVEASSAVAVATDAVREAERRLISAKDWGTYDTWFGGGIISSSIKHDRIDGAKAALGSVQRAVDVAHKELGDVAMALRSTGIERTEDWRAFDIWFDNFWSDWATQNRIIDSLQGVQRLSAELGSVAVRLTQARTSTQQELSTIAVDRRRILDAAAAEAPGG